MQALQTAFDFFRAPFTRSHAPTVAPSVAIPPPEAARAAVPVLSAVVPAAAAKSSAPLLAEPSLARIERTLSALFSDKVLVSFTDNTRTMVSAKHRGGYSHVRLHRMFAGADEATLQHVARFLKARDPRSITALRRYVSAHQAQVRRRASRRVLLSAIGEHHDLGMIFAEINAMYFAGSVEARIGWGRMGTPPGRRRRRRSIKLGSYMASGALIRVHPALDAAWVPRFFVEYIVYHEMLHHVVQMPVRDGRRCMHGAEFKAREKQFAEYARALSWEREHLDRLLAS
jgi:hypothetical protein